MKNDEAISKAFYLLLNQRERKTPRNIETLTENSATEGKNNDGISPRLAS